MKRKTGENLLVSSIRGSSYRIIKHSGFSASVIDSFSIPAGVSAGSTVLAWDGANVLAAKGGAGAGRIFKLSGVNGVIASFATSYTFPSSVVAIAYDGLDVYVGNTGRGKIYKHSGFAKTLIASYSIGQVGGAAVNGPFTFDGRHMIYVQDRTNADQDRIFRMSGTDSKRIITSFSLSAGGCSGIVFDGKNLLKLDTVNERVHKHSGVSKDVIASFVLPSAANEGLAYEDNPINSLDILPLGNTQDLLVAYNSGQTSPNFITKVRKYAIQTNTWGSEISVDSGNTGYTYPALAQIPSTDRSAPNRIILAMRDRAATLINIYFSDDNGVTWTLLSTLSVKDPIHLSMAISGSNLVLVYQRGNTSYSRRSTNNGNTWSAEMILIAAATTRLRTPDIAVRGDEQFIVLAESHPLVGKPGQIRAVYSSDGLTWADYGNVIADGSKSFCMPTVVMGTNAKISAVFVERKTDNLYYSESVDDGKTFNIPIIINSNQVLGKLKGLYNPSLAYYRGGLYLLAEGWDGTASDLVLLKGGTWETVTKPTRYSHMYLPAMGNPEDLDWEMLTKNAPTIVNSAGIFSVQTSGNTVARIYKKNNLGDVRASSGYSFLTEFQVNNGGFTLGKQIYFRFVLQDSAVTPKTRIEIEIHLATTGLDIKDAIAGSYIAGASYVHDLTTKHLLLLTMKDNKLSVWIRHSHSNALIWTSVIQNKTLSTAKLNLLSVDNAVNRVHRHSGVTKILITSFAVVATNNGIAFDGKNVLTAGITPAKIYKHTGLTASVIDSFTTNTERSGLAWDGLNLWCIATTGNFRVFKHSGFTRTVATSFDGLVQKRGTTFRDPLNLITVSQGGRIYIQSGLTGKIINSFSVIRGTLATALTYAGYDLLSADGTIDRIYVYSGVAKVQKTSFSTPGGQIRGLAFDGEVNSSIEFGIRGNVGTGKISIYSILVSQADDGLADGFTSPGDLTGRLTSKNLIKQYVHSGVSVAWGGSGGVIGDNWTIDPGFNFGKEALLEDQLSNYWRSDGDNKPISIVMDAGVGKTFDVDMMALLAVNFKYARFQMNSTNAWKSPPVDQFLELRDEDYVNEIFDLKEASISRKLLNDDPTAGMLSQSGLIAFVAAACVDNDIDSIAWHTDTSGPGAYLKIDLGVGSTKEYIQVRLRIGTTSYSGIYAVEYSDDDITWVRVVGDLGVVGATGERWLSVGWASVGLHRYWRLVLTNTPGGGAFVTEMEWFVPGTVAYKLKQWAQPNRPKYVRVLHRLLHVKNGGRVIVHSGLKKNVVSSFSMPDTAETGLAWDGQNVLTLGTSNNKFFRHSGLTKSILTSFTTKGDAPAGLAYDGEKLFIGDQTKDRILVHSGFSTTLVTSFSTPGTLISALAWDGAHLLGADDATNRVYKHSGLAKTIIDSFSTPFAAGNPEGLAWDGKNVWLMDSVTGKIYKMSGFSKTVLTSYTVPTLGAGLAFDAEKVYSIDGNDSTTLSLKDATVVSDGVQPSNNYFQIFGNTLLKQTPFSSYRFMRILIPPQDTAEGYYKIGRFIAGKFYDASKAFNIGRSEILTPNIAQFSSEEGQRFLTKVGEARRGVGIRFGNKSKTFANELLYILDTIDWGKTPFIFVPDATDLTDFLYARLPQEQAYNLAHKIGSIFDIEELTIEEEL